MGHRFVADTTAKPTEQVADNAVAWLAASGLAPAAAGVGAGTIRGGAAGGGASSGGGGGGEPAGASGAAAGQPRGGGGGVWQGAAA